MKMLWVAFVLSTGIDYHHRGRRDVLDYMHPGSHVFTTQEACLAKAREVYKRRRIKLVCELLPFLTDEE
jgi:hypothetical protein